MKVICIPGIVLCERCLSHMNLARIDHAGSMEAMCLMDGCGNYGLAVVLRFPPVEAQLSLRPIQELA